MATPYSSLYSTFTSTISDYSFINLTDAQIDNILLPYLRGAVVRFDHCLQDLTMDDVNTQFPNATLTLTEQEILSCYMAVLWIKPQIQNTLLLRQTMTDRDFNMTSQANQLKALQGLRKDMEAEAERLVLRYTYDNTDLGGLTTGEPTSNTDEIASEIAIPFQSSIE
jgi:hypothetical protein